MKKALLTLSILLFTVLTYAQDQNGYYFHTFKIENITNDGDAKHIITEIREKTGEKIFYFNDSTDVFRLKTKRNYATNEFFELLISHNFNVIPG